MFDGLPTSQFLSFEDAAQWLACGTAKSLRPNWRHEDEATLFHPLLDKCVHEMAVASVAGQPYPYALDIFASPADITATLVANRGNWPPSGQALYDAAIAAAAALAEKDAQLLDVRRRLIRAFENGELTLYGLRVDARAPRFERIDPHVTAIGQEGELVTVDIEIRDDTMYPDPKSPWSREVAPGPLYEAICMERRALTDWVGRSGSGPNADRDEVPPAGEGMVPASPEEASSSPPDQAIQATPQTNTDPDEVPPAGEGMLPVSPEEASSSLPDQAIQSTPQPNADPEQVPPDAKAPPRKAPARMVARMALDAKFSGGRPPPDLTDKQIEGHVADWREAENKKRASVVPPLPPLPMPSIRTIRREMGKP
jgi:hypothetical protein